MLKTIRVPKNLLYLTDRLPKAHYEDSASKNKLALSLSVKGTKQIEGLDQPKPPRNMNSPISNSEREKNLSELKKHE